MAVYIEGTMPKPKPKNQKDWDRDECVAFVALAKRKGITQRDLAERWLGVHPTTISYWVSEKVGTRKEPPRMAKHLLSCVEREIAKLPDWE